MFQMNNYAKLLWNPSINADVMARTNPKHDDFIIRSLSLTLTFKIPEQIFQMERTCTPQGEQLCQIILKTMHKWRSYGPDKLNLWPFSHLTFKCDLDLQPTGTNLSKDTATPHGKQLWQLILISMHECKSYGPDKLNWSRSVTQISTYLNICFEWHFYSLRKTTMPNYFPINV